MKIRTKISLIILSIAVFLSVFFMIANFIFDWVHHQRYIEIVYRLTKNFTEWNNKYSSKSIGPFAEYYTELQAKQLLEAVEEAYIDSGTNYNLLANDKDLKKLFIDSTYIKDIHGGYAALVYDKKKILICSDPEDAGMGMDRLLEGCSQQLRDKISLLTPKDYLNCYFTYTDDDKSIYNEFASVYFVPESKLMLFYSLSIDDYLKPLLLDMEKERLLEKEKINNEFYLAFKTERKYETFFAILSFMIVYMLSIPLIIKFSKSVSAPISELRNEVQKLGKGSFNISIRESGVDEIRDLINSFNFLGKELSNYMENLKNEVKQRQKIETEINIARKIQESMLPKITTDFASGEFQLGAKLIPAEKVSGDFYDFFFVNGKLVLCIADVSGKGISAAFFMAMTRTLIRNLCFQYSSPEKVLIEANRTLAAENHASMFATVFLCFFDLKTRNLNFSIAGHESVLLIRKDNSIQEIGKHVVVPVGMFPDSAYKGETIEIKNDDMLVFYTDGITEARSPENVFFRIENLKDLLIKNKALNSQDLCDLVIDRVNKFEDNNPYDDMTIMILKKM